MSFTKIAAYNVLSKVANHVGAHMPPKPAVNNSPTVYNPPGPGFILPDNPTLRDRYNFSMNRLRSNVRNNGGWFNSGKRILYNHFDNIRRKVYPNYHIDNTPPSPSYLQRLKAENIGYPSK